MILYTIANPEKIFADEPHIPAPRTVYRGGLIMEAVRKTDGSEVLSRLYSTDPAHFLNPSLAPGSSVPEK